MARRIPIRAVARLGEIDLNEALEGYEAGRNGEAEPGNNRSYSFWHGWRNGRVDGGFAAPDDAARELARDAIRSKFLARKAPS